MNWTATCASLVLAALHTIGHGSGARHDKPPASVLVTLSGEARGGPLAWGSLKSRVLEPLDADLALFCTGECDEYGHLRRLARYSWRRRGPTANHVWDELLAKRPNGTEALRLGASRLGSFDGDLGWGATADARGKAREGSGAIIMESSAQLLEHLRRSGALEAHDWFIFTRPDYYYLCDYPKPSVLLARTREQAASVLAVPWEDGVGDFDEITNDRQGVVARADVPTYLGMLSYALDQTVARGKLWCGETRVCNTHSMLNAYLRARGVQRRYTLLPGVVVREASDSRTGRQPGVPLSMYINARTAFGADERPKPNCCRQGPGKTPGVGLPPTARGLMCLSLKLQCVELCPALGSDACRSMA